MGFLDRSVKKNFMGGLALQPEQTSFEFCFLLLLRLLSHNKLPAHLIYMTFTFEMKTWDGRGAAGGSFVG